MAFSFNIDSVSPNTVSTLNDEIIVNLKITNLPNPSYFKAAIKYGNSYIGYLNSNGEWIKINSLTKDNDEDYCLNYIYVSDLNITDLQIVIKTGEEILPGDYEIKAHRFTESCNYTESENTQIVNFNFPSPTPTATPTPSPTLTPTPTSSPTFTPTLTSTPKPVNSPTSTPKPTSTAKSQETKTNVLAARKELDSLEEDTKEENIELKTNRSFPILALIFIFGGALLIGISLFPLAKDFLKRYNKKHEEKN